MHTETDSLLVIVITPAVIKSVMTRAGLHVPRTRRTTITLAPPAFNRFSIRSTHSEDVVQTVFAMACGFVRGQMSLGDGVNFADVP